jgi:hypothetical protein
VHRNAQSSTATNTRSAAINIVLYAKKPPLESVGSGFREENCRYDIPNASRVG